MRIKRSLLCQSMVPIILGSVLILPGCGGGGGGDAQSGTGNPQPVEQPGEGGGGSGGDAGGAEGDGTGGAEHPVPGEQPGGDGSADGGETGGEGGGTDSGTAAPQFSWRGLAPPEGGGFWDLNDRGDTVNEFGVLTSSGDFRWLQFPPDHDGFFNHHLSNNGWVAGAKRYGGSCSRDEFQAVIWRPDGTVALDEMDTGYPAMYRSSWPTDINDANVVVGVRYTGRTCEPEEPVVPDGSDVPVTDRFFRWEESGLVDLDTLGEAGIPVTIQINNHGALAFVLRQGRFSDGTVVYRSYLREAGGAQRELPAAFSRINQFTDSGMIGGCVLSDAGVETPMIWSAQNGIQEIDPEGRPGCVIDVNEAGDAVGHISLPDSSRILFVYHGGTLYDLHELVQASWRDDIWSVTAINDQGEILVRVRGRGDLVLVPSEGG